MKRFLAALSLVLLSASAASSQDPVVYTGANADRGFAPDQLYQFGEIDHINAFNGNVTLTIPIGPSYPVSSSLSYQLILSYNSNLWDFETRREDAEPFEHFVAHGRLLPGFNAGAGWSLSLGRLLRPRDAADDPPTNPGYQWAYISPDGNRHEFTPTLHPGEAVDPDVSYTRDGSYLRMTLTAEKARKVEMPDGTILRFKDPLDDADPTTSAAEWLLWRIEDRFGNNWVQINYTPADDNWDTWTISDSHSRLHQVIFAIRSHPSYPRIVNRVEMDAFGDSSPPAVWEFSAATQPTLTRECPHNDPLVTTPEQSVPFLTEVELPDLTTYAMPLGDYNTPTTGGCADASGRLRQITLPTLGRIAWTYQPYFFPLPWEPFEPGLGEAGSAKSYGVATRSYLDRNDADLGTWTYTTSITAETDPNIDSFGRELINTVTDPLGHTTKHYFSVNRDPLDPITNPDWPAYEYGLPFTRKSMSGSLFLSTEVFASGSATPERRTYLAFELDEYTEVGRGAVGAERNNRVRERKVAFYDTAGDQFAEATTVYSDFDGLGHYRTVTTGGDLPGENVRVETTRYNRDPDQGTYEIDPATNLPTAAHDFTMLLSSSPWLLNRFDRQEITEGSGPSAETNVQAFCFDQATGFLIRRRTLKGISELGRDLVVEFTDDGFGNVESERYFGGDTQAVLSTSTDLCGLGLPGLEQYEIYHEYASGTLQKSEYLKQDGTLSQELFVHAIDASTGLVAATTDPAGITTTFDYDTLGRLKQELPAAGEGAQVDYTYTPAGAGQAQVAIVRTANPGGGQLAKEIVVFGDLGRVFEEKRELPDGTLNLRQTRYNERGWRESVSELVPDGAPPTHLTKFLDYDPFGRPSTLEPPDGPAHNVTLTYKGVSEVTRTVMIARGEGEFPATSTEIYDRQGRLHQVLEPIGPAGETTTTYAYDAGNRLKRVSMSDGTTTQAREFVYDGRGFLDLETHPEKGPSGNGTVDYDNYDARGHVGRKIDGLKTLVYAYDRAERLESVRETSAAGPLLKEFEYGSDTDGRADGKLLAATRHNYLSKFGGADLEITEAFTYGGRGGRVSKREAQRSGVTWFETEFSWTDLGGIASITYPTCKIPTECTAGNPSGQPARTVTYGYDNGFLEEVNAGPEVRASLAYHPNEMLASLAFSYDDPSDDPDEGWLPAATTHWAADPNAMRRPRRIHTTGVAGGADFDTGVYSYDGAGNIKAMGADVFTYDAASRLRTGTSGSGVYAESSAYDGFGNRTYASTFSVGGRVIPVDPATNRLLDSPSREVEYDNRGNQSKWGFTDYLYDASNQMILQEDSDSGADLSYVYTAADERIVVVNNSIPREIWYLRDLDGLVLRKFERVVGDTDWSKDTIHRQGQVLATESGAGVQHAHLDHLGTIRLWTDETGTVAAHHTYSAFGEEIFDTDDGQEHRFTGHERDRLRSGGCLGTTTVDDQTIDSGQTFVGCDELSSTGTTVTSTEEVRFQAGDRITLVDFAVAAGAVFVAEIDGGLNSDVQDLDYMHARYCSPVQGRFLSVDAAQTGQNPMRPQSWNRYAYVQNDPLSFFDPNGQSRKRVHAYHTREVLGTRGFSEDQINVVVRANLRSDHVLGQRLVPANHATALFLSDPEANLRGGRLARKLLGKAIRFAQKGKEKKALKALGRALHAAEDQVAHRGLGNLLRTVVSAERLELHTLQDESVVIDNDGRVLSIEDPDASEAIRRILFEFVDKFPREE